MGRKVAREQQRDYAKLSNLVSKYGTFKKEAENLADVVNKYKDLNAEWKWYAKKHNAKKTKTYSLKLDAFTIGVEHLDVQ